MQQQTNLLRYCSCYGVRAPSLQTTETRALLLQVGTKDDAHEPANPARAGNLPLQSSYRTCFLSVCPQRMKDQMSLTLIFWRAPPLGFPPSHRVWPSLLVSRRRVWIHTTRGKPGESGERNKREWKKKRGKRERKDKSTNSQETRILTRSRGKVVGALQEQSW